MQLATDNLSPHLPMKVALFGDTRLEKLPASAGRFIPRLRVSLPFVGLAQGEVRLWCDLDIPRLKVHERAVAQGILMEAANILAGMALSELADQISGHLMLAPPRLSEVRPGERIEGIAYRLHLLDGHCDCRVELTHKETP